MSSDLAKETVAENLEYNVNRWGDPSQWKEKDHWGYNWGGASEVTGYSTAPTIASRYLLPHLPKLSHLNIVEIAPGGGRFTTELIRLASHLTLLDLNAACIELCKERFKYYNHIDYFVNDGVSCAMLADHSYDLVASYDSFVHVHPDIIKGYLRQLAEKIVDDGVIWLHHSGHGANASGHRTAMDYKMMHEFANECGLFVSAQHFYRHGPVLVDCISVLSKR